MRPQTVSVSAWPEEKLPLVDFRLPQSGPKTRLKLNLTPPGVPLGAAECDKNVKK